MSSALYIPNLVGYIRVILMAVAILIIFKYPAISLILGFISQVIDALDGTIARKLNQCSLFGSILDYGLDRLVIVCWMILLTVIYPRWWLFFMLIAGLDLIGHQFHMYVTMKQGKTSHKTVDQQQNRLLKFYYCHPAVTLVVCMLQDFWVLVVLANYFYPSIYGKTIMIILTPFLLLKAYINIIKLIHSSRLLISLDRQRAEAAAGSPDIS